MSCIPTNIFYSIFSYCFFRDRFMSLIRMVQNFYGNTALSVGFSIEYTF